MSKTTAIRIGVAIIVLTLVLLGIDAVRERGGDDVTADPGTFTMQEVRDGNRGDYCLVAISGSVYNLSSYASLDERIRPLCGTDATEAMTRIGTSTEAAFAPLKAGVLVAQ